MLQLRRPLRRRGRRRQRRASAFVRLRARSTCSSTTRRRRRGFLDPATGGRRHRDHRHAARRRRVHLPQPARVRPGRRLRAARRRPRRRRAAARLEAERVLAGADPARALHRRERPRRRRGCATGSAATGARAASDFHWWCTEAPRPSSAISRSTSRRATRSSSSSATSIYDLWCRCWSSHWADCDPGDSASVSASRSGGLRSFRTGGDGASQLRPPERPRASVLSSSSASSSNSTPYFSASAAYSSSSDVLARSSWPGGHDHRIPGRTPQDRTASASAPLRSGDDDPSSRRAPKIRELTLMAFYRLARHAASSFPRRPCGAPGLGNQPGVRRCPAPTPVRSRSAAGRPGRRT